MAQVVLVAVMPAVQVFDDRQPAAVVERAGELGEPRADAVGDAVERPEADFGAVLHRVLPAVRLFDAHAEDAADGLVAHGGTVLLGVFAVGPGSHQAAARLAVGEEDGGELADGLHVEVAEGAAAAVGDVAGGRIDLADLGVPEAPEFEQALLAPGDVGAARGVLRIVGARQIDGRRRRGSSRGSARSSTCRSRPSGC